MIARNCQPSLYFALLKSPILLNQVCPLVYDLDVVSNEDIRLGISSLSKQALRLLSQAEEDRRRAYRKAVTVDVRRRRRWSQDPGVEDVRSCPTASMVDPEIVWKAAQAGHSVCSYYIDLALAPSAAFVPPALRARSEVSSDEILEMVAELEAQNDLGVDFASWLARSKGPYAEANEEELVRRRRLSRTWF